MAGGVYTSAPFEANPKCIVVSMLTVIVAHLIDHYGWSLMMDPILFVIVYIGLATYDHLYDCSNQMKTGMYGPMGPVTTIFKPGQTKADEPLNKRNIYLFHLLILPLLLYITTKRNEAPDWMFTLVGSFTAIGLTYHGIKFTHHLLN